MPDCTKMGFKRNFQWIYN